MAPDDHTTTADPAPAVSATNPADPIPAPVDADTHTQGVPDTLDDASIPLRRWSPTDYPTNLAGSGAEKLSASAVAPLVAAARGYRTVTPDKDAIDQAVTHFGLPGDGRSGPVATLRKCANTGDVLVIPLYDAHTITQHVIHGRVLRHDTVQFRPRTPVPRKDGTSAKYLFLTGEGTPLDVHPSTPASWLSDPGMVMISEGTIKTDAALTALLRDAGVSDTELSDTSHPDPVLALRALMERLPQNRRVMFVSVAGVSNWHRHPGWNSVPMRDRHVVIAFDGDLAENPHVWREANAMMSMIERVGGSPAYLDLNVQRETVNGTQNAKVGLDDYLADHGRWGSLANRLRNELPPAPEHHKPGEWRINEETATAEELVEPVSQDGRRGVPYWEPKIPIAGRVRAVLSRRTATEDELTAGRIDPDAPCDEEVQLEIVFDDGGHQHERVTIQGPATLLIDPPAEWHRRGATIPAALARHPAFPPDGPDGRKWLSAIKAHRAEETEITTSWEHMGWVPSASSPVFVVGKQVIGPDGFDPDAANPGVDDIDLAGATLLGVQLPDDKDQARQDLREFLDVHISAWANPQVAAVIVAAMCRPVMPLAQSCPALFTGPPRSGKSWAAAAIMSGWQHTPGTWRENRLPGAAADTFAATEAAAAKTPIWVVDDLAPSPDPAQARAEEKRISDLIRGAANQTAKRRMRRDMTAREALPMRALMIFTAENPLSVSSVMDRAIHIAFRQGMISDDDAKERLDRMRDQDGTSARVVGALIRHMARRFRSSSYAEERQLWAELRNETLEPEAREVMQVSASAARHIKMAADLALGLEGLAAYARDELEDFEAARRISGLSTHLFQLLGDHHRAQLKLSRGRALLIALRSSLAAGHCHLVGLDETGLPCTGAGSARRNRQLGWTMTVDASPRPNGTKVGTVISRGDKQHVLFDQHAAFNAAQRHNPSLLPPGTKEGPTWQSVWDEKLTSVDWKPRKDGAGKPRAVVRTMVDGVTYEGVPIPLESLLAISDDDIDDIDDIDDVQVPVDDPDF